MSKNEWITGITFVGMMLLWAMGPHIGVDKTIVAFMGLTIMMLVGIIRMDDITQSGDALSTLM